MTTRTWRWLTLCACLVAAASACVTESVGKRGGLTEAKIAQMPPPVASAYELFAYKCSRCHTLGRPLGAAITQFDHWKIYVNRMRRQAGSGISQGDATTILVFLKFYAAEKEKELGPGGGDPAPDPLPEDDLPIDDPPPPVPSTPSPSPSPSTPTLRRTL